MKSVLLSPTNDWPGLINNLKNEVPDCLAREDCQMIGKTGIKTDIIVSQMEVGCSGIWGLKPTTQTKVGGTPHKPAQPATQPRAPPTTPDPKTSTPDTEP